MHKMIVGSIVVVLAGTCWVLAQNASSKQRQTPYGQISGMLPSEKAETLTVAPTTALEVPGADPMIVIPPRPESLPGVPVPSIDPPPTTRDMRPSPIMVPNVPPFPAPETKPPVNIVTKSALPGLPPLPPVPGVSVPPLAGGDVRMRYDGTIVPPPLKQPGDPTWNGSPTTQGALPPKNEPSTPTQVDPPNYWQERQRAMDRWNAREVPDRTQGPRIWGSADYLFWFVRPQSSPGLIQAVTGSATSNSGFNQSQVVTLFPYNKIDYGIFSGVRGTIGFWLNPQQTVGLESTYMWFGRTDVHDGFFSSSTAILGRAFVDAATGRNSLYQVSSPGTVDGVITVRSKFHLEGGEANFLLNAQAFGPRLNLLAGFRYLDMSESLRVSEFSHGTNFSIRSFDQFGTRNQFWGGQLGLRWGYEGRRLVANVSGKVGFGAMDEHVQINGNTNFSNGNGTASASGGVLALASNIGAYSRIRPAFVPEAVVNLGYKFAPWGTLTVGYNFLYSTEVVRPGGQMDNVVNTSNLPFAGGTSGRPAFLFKGEDFWVQGINLGLRLQY
jgi:hypothetical protein